MNITRFQTGSPFDNGPFLFMPSVAEYVGFYVTVKNNGNTIIKMKDVRFNLNVAGDSFLALQKAELTASLIEKIELSKDRNKMAGIYLGDVVMAKNKRFKLINDFDAEIQPGQTIKGFAFFDSNIAGVKLAEDYSVTLPTTASLDINGIPTTFDAVGNPTARENASLVLVKIQVPTNQ